MKFKNKPNITFEQEIDKEKLAQEIISKADYSASQAIVDKIEVIDSKPWRNSENKTTKNVTVFSLRVPKEEMLQLKYLSKNSMISINGLCLTAIRSYLKKSLKEFDDQE